jgi:hypothetical protein
MSVASDKYQVYFLNMSQVSKLLPEQSNHVQANLSTDHASIRSDISQN